MQTAGALSWVVCDMVWMPEEGEYGSGKPCLEAYTRAYNVSGVRSSEGALPLRQRVDSPEEPPGQGGGGKEAGGEEGGGKGGGESGGRGRRRRGRRRRGRRRGRQLVKGSKRGRQAHPAAAPIKYEHKAEDCL